MSNLRKMLALKDKGAEQTNSVLAKLMRKIMISINMTPEKVEENNRLWMDNPRNEIPDDSGKRSSFAGNIRKEIERPTMTWRVFEKLIRWTRPTKATFVCMLEHRDGTKSVNQIVMPIDNYVKESLHDIPIGDLNNDEVFEVLRERGFHIPTIIPGIDNDDDETE